MTAGGLTHQDAIEIVARQVTTLALHEASELWGECAMIGDDNWDEITRAVIAFAPEEPSRAEFQAAYQVLAEAWNAAWRGAQRSAKPARAEDKSRLHARRVLMTIGDREAAAFVAGAQWEAERSVDTAAVTAARTGEADRGALTMVGRMVDATIEHSCAMTRADLLAALDSLSVTIDSLAARDDATVQGRTEVEGGEDRA